MEAQFIYGSLSIANVFLALIAALFALSLFAISHQRDHLRPWKLVIIILALFAGREILSFLEGLELWNPSFLPSVITTLMLAILSWAVIWQTHITE